MKGFGQVSAGEGQDLGYMGKQLKPRGHFQKYRLTMFLISSRCPPGTESEQMSTELPYAWIIQHGEANVLQNYKTGRLQH
jgi:hypothetical protein